MRKQSIATQILALNAAIILATTLAGILAGRLAVGGEPELRQALVILVGIFAAVLVNAWVLRRRFRSLDGLIDLMEDIDLSRPGLRADVASADTIEVVRLCGAFNRMLERVEAERARTGSAVLAAQEQERARLARDLHDECNQALTGILLRLEAVGQDSEPAMREELQTIKGLTSTAMEELLHLARELRPSALDDHGLRIALQAQLERFQSGTGLRTSLQLASGAGAALEALSEQEQTVVYRVVQEALSNVIQHADARSVAVSVDRDDRGRTVVLIRDDGRGLVREREGGLGLPGMRERSRLAGGSVSVAPGAGGGTEVRLTLGSSSSLSGRGAA